MQATAVPMPVYVINLDRQPDRWLAISARLNALGIGFERIRAIDANDLPIRARADGMDAGSRACMMSHCRAIHAFLGTGSGAALVLEDDALIASDTASLLDSVDWWPDGTGAVKLETKGTKPRILGATLGQTPSGRSLRCMHHGSAGAAGYLIGRSAAEMVLAACARTPLAIDVMLFGLHRSSTARRLRPAQIFPAMVRQRLGPDDPSDLPSSRAGRAARRQPKGRFGDLDSTRHNIAAYTLLVCGVLDRIPVPYSDTPAKA